MFVFSEMEEHCMPCSHPDAAAQSASKRPHSAVISYFVRHRLSLYVLSGAVVATGIALNWNWLSASGLLSILVFLPCMVMMFMFMFMCMKHGARAK